MKFLVLGAGGMAGHMISLFLQEQGHDVVGLARRRLGFLKQSTICDVTDLHQLENIVGSGKYDFIVNAIGILNNDAEARKADAVFLNAYLPHQLAAWCDGTGTKIVHISTDCVFSGDNGFYYADSFPDGQTFYDRSKALGELCDSVNLTLRQSIVGPDINENGIGLLHWFMGQQGSVNGFSNCFWTGLTTLELAKAIEACAKNGVTGLINMVPDSNIKKSDLLGLFNAYLRGGTVYIAPKPTPRINKTLVRNEGFDRYLPLPYKEQIIELREWIVSHRELYGELYETVQ